MKIEEYLSTLPQSILSGEEIQIPPDTIREIFKFAEIGEDDTFYHLGSGNGISLKIARDEFNVKNEYDEFIMPIRDFKKSGMLLANQINPKKITSIGIVAYGRDHYAELYVKELEFLE